MFEDRIKRALCDYIDLENDECDVYAGAGIALAFEKDGKLTELLYAGRVDEDEWKVALNRAFNERVWLVHCSSQQLTEPELINPENSVVFARAMRRWAEAAY